VTNLDICSFFRADVDLLVTESDLRKGEGTRTGEAVSVWMGSDGDAIRAVGLLLRGLF
jgi:hypothetical protein